MIDIVSDGFPRDESPRPKFVETFGLKLSNRRKRIVAGKRISNVRPPSGRSRRFLVNDLHLAGCRSDVDFGRIVGSDFVFQLEGDLEDPLFLEIFVDQDQDLETFVVQDLSNDVFRCQF